MKIFYYTTYVKTNTTDYFSIIPLTSNNKITIKNTLPTIINDSSIYEQEVIKKKNSKKFKLKGLKDLLLTI